MVSSKNLRLPLAVHGIIRGMNPLFAKCRKVASNHTKNAVFLACMSSMTAKFSGLTHGNTAMGAGSEPKVSDKEPIANVEKYLSLGVAVADIPESVAFYAKLGFEHKYTDGAMTLLKHVGGFEIHLLKADKPHKDNLNILMDYPKNKFPGINHMSFSVPSVAACRDYLISQGIPIKDTRQYPNDPRIYALFIRDPSATTIEFENNSGEDTQFEGPFSSKHIGEIRPIDHVGIRVADPDDLELWYAEKLGFNRLIAKFVQADPDPLKRGRPIIVRSQAGVDINLIVNTNERPGEHVLYKGGEVVPGIIYAHYWIKESISSTAEKLVAEGVTVVKEADLEKSSLSFLACRHVPSPAGTTSIYVQDPCKSIIRLSGTA